ANRLRLTLEPWSGWRVGGEAGHARGRYADSAAGAEAETEVAVRSLRTEVFAGFQAGATRVDASAESKRARDPGRRDNDRRRIALETAWHGWLPQAGLLHDAWATEGDSGTAHSELWQPRIAVESPALAGRGAWAPEADALYGRSDYDGRRPGLADSLIDVGVSQRLRLIGWGPVTGEVQAGRRHQRVWRPDETGERALASETAVYDQADANVSAA